jgi:deoxyribose-phosphate aldolase
MKSYYQFLNESKKPSLNKIIEYTYLRNNVNIDKIEEICQDAIDNDFYSICIFNDYVKYAKYFLDESNIKINTVISYPNGKNDTKTKLKEIDTAIINGVDGVNVVFNFNLLKKINDENSDKIIERLKSEVNDISRYCHGINSIELTMIIETGELTLEQIKMACDICSESGVDYIQTSTGKFSKGAEIDKVKFMRKILPDYVHIKAAGGIRTNDDIQKFINAGSSIICTSINPNLI